MFGVASSIWYCIASLIHCQYTSIKPADRLRKLSPSDYWLLSLIDCEVIYECTVILLKSTNYLDVSAISIILTDLCGAVKNLDLFSDDSPLVTHALPPPSSSDCSISQLINIQFLPALKQRTHAFTRTHTYRRNCELKHVRKTRGSVVSIIRRLFFCYRLASLFPPYLRCYLLVANFSAIICSPSPPSPASL